ncbi:MAG: hypothetical protein AAFX50_07170 [Acidobacteriota bacterium]
MLSGALSGNILEAVGSLFDAHFVGELRRPHDLNAGGSVIDGFEVAAAAPAGADSVRLRPAGGGRLTGSLPAGIAVAIEGAAYAAAAPATATGVEIDVEVSEALAEPVAAGAAVEMGDYAIYALEGAVLGPVKERTLPEELRGVASATLATPVRDNAVLPERDDILFEAKRGRTYRVISVPLEGAGISECHLSTGGA